MSLVFIFSLDFTCIFGDMGYNSNIMDVFKITRAFQKNFITGLTSALALQNPPFLTLKTS